MKTFVSSDWHIGHTKILEYDNRPFTTIEQHDDMLIKRINDTVGKDDQLIVLGDVYLGSSIYANKYLKAIKCKHICLVPGNHDGQQQITNLMNLGWTLLPELFTIPKMVFCHYPIEERRNRYRGWKHYHGHSHHRGKEVKNRIDVGLTFGKVSTPLPLGDVQDIATMLSLSYDA